MWMTRQFTGAEAPALSETGRFRIANNVTGISGTMELRDVPVYVPWGVSFLPPAGSEVLLLQTQNGTACVGARLEPLQGLQPGEICLFSGGTRLLLKNDGEIELGKVTIRPDGTIRAKAFEKEGEKANGNENG